MVKNKKTMKQHEEFNFLIPKRSILPLFLTIIGILLIIGNFYVIINSWEFLELGSLTEEIEYQLHDLMIIPLLILQYLLISLTIYSFGSIFKKLKNYDEVGLIDGLIIGLIIGLIVGLIIGLIVGLIGAFN